MSCKHACFKYIRLCHQYGLRLLTSIAIVVGTRSKPAHCIYNAISTPTYRINTATTTYSVSAHDSARKVGALVDRGANGGIAGNDVRIIATTDRSVDVQGVSNHQVTDIPIVTCGAVVNTHRGDAILIMNQYARVRNGKTIHSCVQLEAHKHNVDDKSIAVLVASSASLPQMDMLYHYMSVMA